MKLLKPSWVSHDGNPIFSIDIHPDSSRFVTGGQGDNCGKVVIWNMAPIRSEKEENDESVPKMLCTMDNHLACVNCVRWSNNGKFLASGGDDKLIMIWQASRSGFGSSSFGSDVVNVESWRCVFTLRGHHGDVLDLAWSAHDAWLATCSVDNTIIVWNANKFPEEIKTLRGHTGMVKGVTWDPVGKYLASQSDDKSLRVWRTLDWQQETVVTQPFEECGGTTHVLRLGWSPDGHYVVSAHAMNNSGPTAQIIERDGWKLNMDFVGHRKAVTCVRFNPNILEKKIKKNSEKLQMYSCCAIGSRDRSLSIWLTVLKRPLVVTHDLFQNSIMDISWSQSGKELICCSWDGSVAYMSFSKDELGNALTPAEKAQIHQRVYGKSVVNSVSSPANQIIETTAIMKLQQQKQEEKQKTPSNLFQPPETSPEKNPIQETEVTPKKTSNSISRPIMNGGTPSKTDHQIETKTKDGRRRITPIFLAPQPAVGDAPRPFISTNSNEPVFSSSTKQSDIVVEKKAGITPPSTPKATEAASVERINALLDTTPIQAMTTSESRSSEKAKPHFDKERDKERVKIKSGIKRKAEAVTSDGTPVHKRKPGRPKKDKTAEPYLTPPLTSSQPLVQPVETQPPKIIYMSSGLNLPVPNLDRSVSILISGSVGTESCVVLELENTIHAGNTTLHRVTCTQGGQNIWQVLLTSKMIAAAGNSHISCLSCADHSIHVFNSASGRRMLPIIVLDSKISILKCLKHIVMVITSKGYLFVWDTQSGSAVIKNESLVGIIPTSEIRIEHSVLTENGMPILTLSNGKSYTFQSALGCWVLLSSRDDTLFLCSDHKSCIPAGTEYGSNIGILAGLQNYKHKAGSQAGQLFRNNHTLQQPSTLSHLENQLASALTLMSQKEYRMWLMTYVRFLVQEGIEVKLRAVCDELLGPVYKSKSHPKWQPKILDMSKHKLLEEILPLVGSNLQLQRIFTEYHEQLEAGKS